MPAPVVVHVRQDGPVARLTLSGELDLAWRRRRKRRGPANLDVVGIDELIVDLAGLTFIDSCGIAALVKCKKGSLEVGKALRIIGSRGPVADVLKICGLISCLAGNDGES